MHGGEVFRAEKLVIGRRGGFAGGLASAAGHGFPERGHQSSAQEGGFARARDAAGHGEASEGNTDVDILQVVQFGAFEFQPAEVFALKRAARPARGAGWRVGQAATGHGIFRGADFVERAGGNHLAAAGAGAGSEIDDPGGAVHGCLIVFDDEEGVALFDQFVERVEQAAVVAFVESDSRFVEHVEDAAEVGAKLRGEADALGFAAGERSGGTVEGEVVEADALHETEALTDFGKNIPGEGGVVGIEGEGLEQGRGFAGAGMGEVGDGMIVDANVPGFGVEAHALAFGAGAGDILVGFFAGLFLLQVGLELGAGVVRSDSAVIDEPEPSASFAPAVGRVEREHARVERFEGAGAGRAGHFGAE